MIPYLVLLTGCGHTMLKYPAEYSVPLQGTEPQVGAARALINPPLGRVLGGHGPNGTTALGRRGDLECQVVYMTSGGQVLAWANCDLPFVSTALQREVVKTVRRGPPGPCASLGDDNFVLTATHTHAGPGSHFVEGSYTAANPFELDSFKPRDAGFDIDYFHLLAEQIAAGVQDACSDASPGAEARWAHTTIDTSITRNRSVLAHCEDPESRTQCAASEDPRLNTDQRFDVLTLESGGRPKAVMAFFAIHPTAVPNGNEVYHGDLFAETRAAFRDQWAGGPDSAPVFTLVNGAEGDVSPAWPLAKGAAASDAPAAPGFALARAIADVLAANALSLAVDTTQPAQPLTLRQAHEDLTMWGGQAACPSEAPCAQTLDALGSLGTAAAAGAEDGPTIYRYCELAYAEGQKSGRVGLDPKRTLKDALTPTRFSWLKPIMGTNKWSFAGMAPLGLVELNGKRILLFPGEATTVAGQRLRTAGGADIVAGLASGYIQYLTTREEYADQQYEGASTLYGPNELDYFLGHVRALAKSVDAGGPARLLDVVNRPRNISIGRGLVGNTHHASTFQLSQFTGRGHNPEGDVKPIHAGTPDGGSQAMPLELVIPKAGRALWSTIDPWSVTVTDRGGNRVRNRHGVAVDEHETSIEVRILPSFFNRIPVLVSWFPDEHIDVGDEYCLAAQIPGDPDRFEACRVFTGPGWSEVSSTTLDRRGRTPDEYLK